MEVNPISCWHRQPRVDGGQRRRRDILIVLATAALLTVIFAPLTTHLYRTRS